MIKNMTLHKDQVFRHLLIHMSPGPLPFQREKFNGRLNILQLSTLSPILTVSLYQLPSSSQTMTVDRPNPTGIPFVCFSTLPSNTSSRLITKASRVNRSFDERYRDLVVSDSSRIGYRMARGTHGIDRPGSWYFEVSIGCDLINIEKNSTEQSFNYLTKAESLSTDENPIDLAFLKVSSNPKDTATESHFGHDTAYSEDLKNIKKSTNKGHIRLGIAQILAQTEAPVGFDEYGYGIRSTDGSTIHCATVDESVKNIGFSPGDIVGVLVCLPEENSMMSDDGRITLMTKADTFDEFRQVLRAPDQKLSNQNNVDKLTSKGINVYNFTDPKRSKIKDSNLDNSEEIKTLDEPLEKMQKIYRPLGLGEYKVCQELHPHSSVRFFINGSEVQNFSPIYRAKYYPAVSLYGDAAAILNCGPNFVHLSSTLAYGNVSPVCELAKFDS